MTDRRLVFILKELLATRIRQRDLETFVHDMQLCHCSTVELVESLAIAAVSGFVSDKNIK